MYKRTNVLVLVNLVGEASTYCNDNNVFCRCVDLRTCVFDVPPQEVLTKDSVTVSVDAVVFYQVVLPCAD